MKETLSSTYFYFKKIKKAFLIIALAFSASFISAQYNGLPKVIPPSPEAASLGKYGDVQVGHYTGVPSIGVPIYNISIDNVSVPIGLSYHSGGIKVEEIASNVGLGWSLNAGGVITSSVRGLYDFTPGGKGFVRGAIDVLPANLTPLNGIGQKNQPDYDLCKRVAKGELDSEPDLFFFNFAGRSGKFFFDQQGNARTIPFSKLQIKFFPVQGYFTIKDENGNLFTFSKQESTFSNAAPACSNGGGGYYEYSQESFSYYLTGIVTHNNRLINFVYSDYQYTYENSNVEEDYTKYSNNLGLCDNIPAKTICYPKTMIAGRRISQINVPQQQLVVDFTYNAASRLDLPGSKSLQSIAIKRNTVVLKSFTFVYDYFTSPNIGAAPADKISTYYRLKLLSVLEVGKTPYTFEYNPVLLPHRFSKAQDWWGYYNGDDAASSLLPEAEIQDISLVGTGPRTIPGSKRLPNKDFMGANQIKKIIYPTGGETIFDFEPHDSYKERTINIWTPAGRTVNISQNESNTYTQSFDVFGNYADRRNFKINYSNSAAGLTNIVQVYITGPNNYNRVFEGPCPPGGLPLSFPEAGTYYLNIYGDGTHNAEFATISWEDRTEQQQNGNFIAGGMRIKKITTDDKTTPVIQTKTYEYTQPSNILRSSGILMHDLDYHYFVQDMQSPKLIPSGQNQSEYTLCRNLVRYGTSPLALGQLNGSSVAYEYVTVKETGVNNIDNGKTEYFFLTNKDLGPYLSYPYPSPTDYDWMRGQSVYEKYYKRNTNGSYTLLKQVNHEYNFNHTYSFYGSSNPNELIIKMPKISNRIGAYEILNNFNQPQEVLADFAIEYTYVVSAWPYQSKETVITYDQNGGNPLTTITDFNYTNPSHAQPTAKLVTNSTGELLKQEMKYPHDFTGTLVYDTMVARNMISTVIQQKSYQNATLLSTMNNNHVLFNTEKLALTGTIQTAQASNSLETEVTFNSYDSKGNILQYTPKDGVPVSFLWDYISTYPIAKASNALQTEIAYTSFEADGTGNWTIASTARNTTATNIITGKQAYGLSSGQITKTVPAGKQYIVTYWTAGTTSATVRANGVTIAGTLLFTTANGKRCYQHVLPNTTNSVAVSGTNVIDELRLHPKDAQMMSHTYAPLIGMTSSNTNNNIINVFEYDALQRLKLVRDLDGNIVKKNDYQYQLNTNQ